MTRNLKVIFLAALLLAFALALVPGCASLTGETAGENIDDNTITAEANAIIIKDPQAHYLKIDVETTKGDVVLTGFVDSTETADRLVGKIKEIKGVKSVRNLLKIEEKK
jgi:hyperosmotically inducible protein